MGGWLALRLASQHPERVGHVVALNPAGLHLADEELARIRKLYDVNSYGDYIRFMRHLWHRIPLAFYPFAALGFYQFTREPVFRTLLDTFKPEHGLDEPLTRLEMPLTVVWGRSDTLFPEEMGRRIASLAPKGRFHPVDKAGHMPQVEAAREVFRVIDEAARGL
jgi:2-hydroxy-6-oxo-octa-2,4-dienoate hydrolase